MRHHKSWLLVLIATLSLSVWPVFPVAPAHALDPSGSAIARVLQIQGKAFVRRKSWADFAKLSVGAPLEAKDLVDPSGGVVYILCPNLTQHIITQLGPPPCPSQRALLVQDNQALAGWQRGSEVDLTMPFLISPRATMVSSPNPVLLWNSVTDADGYTVTLRGEGLSWSSTVTGGTTDHLTYPKDAPLLKPGVSYSVEVTALQQGVAVRSSSEEDAPDMSFTVISPQDYAPIRAAVSQIYGTVRDKHVADLIVADFLAQSGLVSDAFQLLWGLSGDVLDSSAVPKAPLTNSAILYLSLADTGLRSHLDLFATAAYRRALDLSTANGETENQALAAVGLARVVINVDQQKQYAQQAVDLWNQIGATAQATLVSTEFNLSSN